jgi:hypothetical protein
MFLLGILIFKGFTARRKYKPFGVKGSINITFTKEFPRPIAIKLANYAIGSHIKAVSSTFLSHFRTRFPHNVQSVSAECDDFNIGVLINGVQFIKRT